MQQTQKQNFQSSAQRLSANASQLNQVNVNQQQKQDQTINQDDDSKQDQTVANPIEINEESPQLQDDLEFQSLTQRLRDEVAARRAQESRVKPTETDDQKSSSTDQKSTPRATSTITSFSQYPEMEAQENDSAAAAAAAPYDALKSAQRLSRHLTLEELSPFAPLIAKSKWQPTIKQQEDSNGATDASATNSAALLRKSIDNQTQDLNQLLANQRKLSKTSQQQLQHEDASSNSGATSGPFSVFARLSNWFATRQQRQTLQYNDTMSRLEDSLTRTQQLNAMATTRKSGTVLASPSEMRSRAEATPFLTRDLPTEREAANVRRQQGKVFVTDANCKQLSLQDLLQKSGKVTLLTISYNAQSAQAGAVWCQRFIQEFKQNQRTDQTSKTQTTATSDDSNSNTSSTAATQDPVQLSAPVQCVQLSLVQSRLLSLLFKRSLVKSSNAQLASRLLPPHNCFYSVFDAASINRLERLNDHHIARRSLMTQIFLCDTAGRWRWKAYHECSEEEIARLVRCTLQLCQEQQEEAASQEQS